MQISEGVVLGDWTIAGKLGAGGMATVYLARNPRGVRCALKVGNPDANDPEGKRFLREIHTLASLSHPAIVGILDYGTDPLFHATWLAMELVPGDTLAAEIARGPIAAHRARTLFRGLADGLAHAHALGVYHRDIKPSNIVVHGDRAVLVDFGIARTDDSTRMTRTGMFLGTPAYMPPEVFSDGTVEPGPADVYALGQVLFEALTGRDAFPTDNTLSEGQRFARIFSAKARPGYLDPGPGVDSALRAVTRSATESDPARRIGGMAAFRDGMSAAAPETSWIAMPPSGAAPSMIAGTPITAPAPPAPPASIAAPAPPAPPASIAAPPAAGPIAASPATLAPPAPIVTAPAIPAARGPIPASASAARTPAATSPAAPLPATSEGGSPVAGPPRRSWRPAMLGLAGVGGLGAVLAVGLAAVLLVLVAGVLAPGSPVRAAWIDGERPPPSPQAPTPLLEAIPVDPTLVDPPASGAVTDPEPTDAPTAAVETDEPAAPVDATIPVDPALPVAATLPVAAPPTAAAPVAAPARTPVEAPPRRSANRTAAPPEPEKPKIDYDAGRSVTVTSSGLLGVVSSGDANSASGLVEDAVATCYVARLADRPSLAGKLTVELKTDPSGVVESVAVKGDLASDGPLRGCIEKSGLRRRSTGVRGITKTTLSYTLKLSPVRR